MSATRRAAPKMAPDGGDPDDLSLDVEEAGQPQLLKDGEPVEGDPAGFDVPQLVAIGWTPQQAAMFVCGMFNLGIIFYGPDWTAHPSEAAGWDVYAAQLLDRVLPRGEGAGLELGIAGVMMAQGVGTMAARRAPLIAAGPKPLWKKHKPADILQLHPSGPGSTRPDQAAAPAPPPAPAPELTGRYRLDPDLIRKAQNAHAAAAPPPPAPPLEPSGQGFPL